ncbi:MAG: DUF3822 family protein [Bacteroidetes bacterium]|nr:DUF3822 family protein [Bacteroidota bacterium]
MVKPSFYIRSQNSLKEDAQQQRLLLEVNENSLGYILFDVKKMTPSVIKHYQFTANNGKALEEILQEILEGDELLMKNADEVILVYNFEESNLVPEKFFSQDSVKDITDLVHGNLHRGTIFNEKIPWWELYNVYRVSSDIDLLFRQKFSAAKTWHAYSLLLKSYKMFHAKENPLRMNAVFYEDRMIVSLFKNSKLQLIQTFVYQDRKDVLYHLLNCCKQFNINTEEVMLELSGLIDKQSALFTELQKYFLNISFEEISSEIIITDELKEYPLHYFSSLLRMAVCV